MEQTSIALPVISEPMNRREWIKITASAVSGIALSSCTARNLIPISSVEEDWPDYTEKWIASACLQCDGGCGVLARVIDGRVTKLEGNPLHPVNRGRLCPLGQAGVQLLYNPDRIKAPMKRVGGKGADKWVRLGWDEAIQTVADHLAELRQRDEPHSLAVFDGSPRGLMRNLLQRFCDAYGTPNHIDTTQPDAMTLANELAQGLREPFVYDLEGTEYVLSFGCGLLDGWRSPVGVARAYGYLRQERPGPKAKLVQIERRFSATAARVDEWVPINPGTEGALALAIAYVLIREELYDRDFVRDYTFGFEDWKDEQGESHLGFKSLVLGDYRPDDVSGITGVPVDAIIRLAKEFAQSKPALAIADANATGYSNGTYTTLAIHALNALKGNIDLPGGVLVQEPVPFKPWPEITKDSAAQRGGNMPRIDAGMAGTMGLLASPIEEISENIANAKPYPVRAAFFYNSNPLFSTRLDSQFRRALETVPLVVSFATFLDETAEHADLILPDHLYLEKWEDRIAPPLSGTPALGLAQPAIEPLYDTMHTGDFFLKLSAAMGGTIAETLSWADFKDVLKSSVQGVYEAERGAVFTEPPDEAYLREMQQRGWATNEFGSYDEFWDRMVEKGGWSGLYHSHGRWGKVLNTPSHKFEFFSQKLKAELESRARITAKSTDSLLEDLSIEARGDRVFLPHFEPIKTQLADSDYPLYLNPFSSLALASANGANLPWVQETAGDHFGVKWDSWAEINPATATELGIEDGDQIWIESQRGKITTKARLYPGAMPDVISVPAGLGHKALGRWAKGRGANPSSIIDLDNDGLSGSPAWFSTRVKVYKA